MPSSSPFKGRRGGGTSSSSRFGFFFFAGDDDDDEAEKSADDKEWKGGDTKKKKRRKMRVLVCALFFVAVFLPQIVRAFELVVFGNDFAVREAHENKHTECLQYLLDNNCPLPSGWRYERGELHSSQKHTQNAGKPRERKNSERMRMRERHKAHTTRIIKSSIFKETRLPQNLKICTIIMSSKRGGE